MRFFRRSTMTNSTCPSCKVGANLGDNRAAQPDIREVTKLPFFEPHPISKYLRTPRQLSTELVDAFNGLCDWGITCGRASQKEVFDLVGKKRRSRHSPKQNHFGCQFVYQLNQCNGQVFPPSHYPAKTIDGGVWRPRSETRYIEKCLNFPPAQTRPSRVLSIPKTPTL